MDELRIDPRTSDAVLQSLLGKYLYEAHTTGPAYFLFLSSSGNKVVGVKRADEDPNIVAILFAGHDGLSFIEAEIKFGEY